MDAAEERLRAGDLAGCLAELQKFVRANPASADARLFLAQLYMVLGDWPRAVTQLSVTGELEASALPTVHLCRIAIQCESFRASVFRGERAPLLLGEPEPWIATLLQSVASLGQGRVEEAAALRAQAFEQAPASSGELNGERFEWLADADSRFGPMLEVILKGAYYWVPVSRISSLEMNAPSTLRDLVWMPARITWVNGGEATGLIPARYPGTESNEDPALRLGRRTDWQQVDEHTAIGLGQRMLSTDTTELGLLDVRRISLSPAS